MNRLSPRQKMAVFAACPHRREGGKLVRVGATWTLVWFEPEQPRSQRWRGLVISHVDGETVWFAGSEVEGATRREVVAALSAEVVS